ncbi:MAG TPA: hypothetical protein VGD23_04505 [Sphingomicrobium sp.]
MTDPNQQPEKKGSNTWWIAGAALVLGYYVGQGEKPADSGAAYAEAPAITPAEDDIAAEVAVDEALEAAAAAVEEAEATAQEVADTSEFVAPEADQVEYAYASDPLAPSEEGDADEADTPSAGSVAAVVGATTVASSDGPWSRYQSSGTSTATQPTTSYSSSGYQPYNSGTTYRPRTTYVPPVGTYAAPKCESTGCYGVISTTTGRPRTQYVSGYYRKDGTYVRPYYRSRRN